MVKYDKEYSTQWLVEVDFLKENNIEPSFNKIIDGVKTFKYTKNKELFLALSELHK